MLAADSPERPSAQAPGRIGQALIRMLMKRATIVATETLAGRFRLITLEGPELEGVAWVAGQKVQIAMGSAFVTRTYTPIEWNAATGRACILGYVHGSGPGSTWVADVGSGDQCDLFGPRGSIDVRDLSGPLAVFGDETAIGLAHALVYRDPARPVACHFELDDAVGGRELIAQLGLDGAALFARRAGDAHLAEMEARLPALVAAGASFVLAGKAGTIQRVRQGLKRYAVPASRIVTKAYWAPGKAGLD
jgi:NADPH-dependent ferric siderophore reductase